MSTGYMVPAPPFVAPNATVVALATGTSLTVASHAGKNITNTGAGGTIKHTLPAASGAAGISIRFQSTVNQIVQVDPNSTDKIYLGGDGVAGKYLNIAAAIGNYAELYCDGEQWHVIAYSGVLTKEG